MHIVALLLLFHSARLAVAQPRGGELPRDDPIEDDQAQEDAGDGVQERPSLLLGGNKGSMASRVETKLAISNRVGYSPVPPQCCTTKLHY